MSAPEWLTTPRQHDVAAAIFRLSDHLAAKAQRARVEAESLERAAEKLHGIAAAVADGRDDEIAGML